MEAFLRGATASPIFAQRFRARAGAAAELSFADFVDVALYDPEAGYYRRTRLRVGLEPGADFYTATSLDRVTGRLVAAATTRLLELDRFAPSASRDCEFLEIGAEPGRELLANVAHRFRAVRTLRVGDQLTVPAHAVVFSNELFDAQPFHRVLFLDGVWREVFVRLHDEKLESGTKPVFSPEVQAIAHLLPTNATQGYTIDLPIRATELLQRIVAQKWRGLFVAGDYGRTWAELTNNHPQGTARAYLSHRQSNDLLAHAGEQDLTCHICWDWLEERLRAAGFSAVRRESQEAFFIHHASDEIERIIREDADPLSPARSQLKHLLHPGLLGQRFEVLWGLRR